MRASFPYRFFSDKDTLRLDPKFVPKVNSFFHLSQELVLPVLSESDRDVPSSLDVKRALSIYLQRTAEFRVSDSLFVCFASANKGQKATAQTLSRWIKLAISKAYKVVGLYLALTSVQGRSTRSVSASWAELGGASMLEIC